MTGNELESTRLSNKKAADNGSFVTGIVSVRSGGTLRHIRFPFYLIAHSLEMQVLSWSNL